MSSSGHSSVWMARLGETSTEDATCARLPVRASIALGLVFRPSLHPHPNTRAPTSLCAHGSSLDITVVSQMDGRATKTPPTTCTTNSFSTGTPDHLRETNRRSPTVDEPSPPHAPHQAPCSRQGLHPRCGPIRVQLCPQWPRPSQLCACPAVHPQRAIRSSARGRATHAEAGARSAVSCPVVGFPRLCSHDPTGVCSSPQHAHVQQEPALLEPVSSQPEILLTPSRNSRKPIRLSSRRADEVWPLPLHMPSLNSHFKRSPMLSSHPSAWGAGQAAAPSPQHVPGKKLLPCLASWAFPTAGLSTAKPQ